MPLTLKSINAELAKRGRTALLENGGGYFYFVGGETADWLDRTVRVPKVSSMTLEQWVEEFDRLKKRNAEIFQAGTAKTAPRKKRSR